MIKPKWSVSMDPGLRGCGVAVFEEASLFKAWYSKNPNRKDRGPQAWYSMAEAVSLDWVARLPLRIWSIDALVLEVPQVYRQSRADPADLIELAGVVGAVTYGIPASRRLHYLPREWKGSVPKDVHNTRVLGRLSVHETERIEETPRSLVHNVVDAVGLGLCFLGRLKGRK